MKQTPGFMNESSLVSTALMLVLIFFIGLVPGALAGYVLTDAILSAL